MSQFVLHLPSQPYYQMGEMLLNQGNTQHRTRWPETETTRQRGLASFVTRAAAGVAVRRRVAAAAVPRQVVPAVA